MLRVILTVTIAVLFNGGANASEVAIEQAAMEIDRLLQQSWDRDEITPVPESGDAEFHRRAWLDLAGVAPSVAATRRFLNDQTIDKRGRLIDRLLDSPQHANHMATRWNAILLPADSVNPLQQQASVTALHQWLRKEFLSNTPYDHLVGRFLTAGGVGNEGPAIFYTTRSLEPKKVAAATSRVFMGIQLQCAECHDHPFDRWTQKDFWQYTAFFSQLTQTDSNRGQRAIIEDRVGAEVNLPETDQIASPMYPGVSEPPEKDPLGVRRRQLTIWMASRDNPYFARAAVNRVWDHLFGRGLVDPVDAMDENNKPSHPELLQFLSDYFVQHRFDLRDLYATLARTEAYGRTSAIVNADDIPADSFAVMSVKTLSAEQFYDSLQQNVFRQSATIAAADMSSETMLRDQFLSRMRTNNASSHEYPHGVVQVLGLMNGPEVQMATDVNRIGLLASLEAPFLYDTDRIETLFLATLSRLPSDNERTRFLKHLDWAAEPSAKAATMADLLWVLLNTAECAVSP